MHQLHRSGFRGRGGLTVVVGSLLVALVALGGCSSDTDTDTDTDSAVAGPTRSDVLAALAADVIIPGQEALEAAADELATATAALCASPSQATLDAARDAWNDTQSAWFNTSSYSVGPASSLRSRARIGYQIDPSKVAAVAAGPEPVTVDLEAVRDLGADRRGLHAIEQLLFDPDDVVLTSPRACAYAAAASAVVAEATAELSEAWTSGIDGEAPWSEQLAEGTGGFDDVDDALGEIVNQSLMALSNTMNMQLEPALGDSSGTPEPLEADPGIAQRALVDARAALAGARQVFVGGDGAVPGDDSLAALVRSAPGVAEDGEDDDPAETYLSSLDAAIESLEQVEGPLATIDTDTSSPDMVALRAAADELAVARTTLRTQIASRLGITVTFSDADGDG